MKKRSFSSSCCNTVPSREGVTAIKDSIYYAGYCSKCKEVAKFLEYFPVPRIKEV